MNTAVLTSVDVAVANYDTAVLDAARGVLEGYTGEYYFFQYNIDMWVLVLYDSGISSHNPYGLFTTDCEVVQIGRTVIDTPYTVSHDVSGSIISENPGRFQGSYSTTEHMYTTSYFITSYHADFVNITNTNGYLVYGSADPLPHLIEGVQNYAYMQTFLLVGVILFVLADRIFRRVY